MMTYRFVAVGLVLAGCAHSDDAPRATSAPPVASTPAPAPVVAWTRVAAGSALEDSAYPSDPVPRPEAAPIDHFGREPTSPTGRCSAFARFELPTTARLATRVIDNAVESIVPLVPDDASYRRFVITFAGPVSEIDDAAETAAADRELVISMPAGVAPDVHVGQHLRGRVVFEDEGMMRAASVELSDDRGVVLQIDPHSIDTSREPAAVRDYSEGPKRARRKSDEWFELRHAVLATLPGGTAPAVLDGWSRHATPSGTYDVCGEELSLKPGAQVYDYFGSLDLDVVRVPAVDALPGQLHPVLAYDEGKGDPLTAIPPAVKDLPGHQGALSFSIEAFDRRNGEGCTGPVTRDIDGTVEAIGKLRGNWSDASSYGWAHYVVRFAAGSVTEHGAPVDPRLFVALSRGDSLDLAVGRHVHGTIDVCPAGQHHVELHDDAGLLAAFVWTPSPTAPTELAGSITYAQPPSQAGDDSLALTLPGGTQLVQHGWSRWSSGSAEYVIYAARYVLDPPYVKAHSDSIALGVTRLPR